MMGPLPGASLTRASSAKHSQPSPDLNLVQHLIYLILCLIFNRRHLQVRAADSNIATHADRFRAMPSDAG